MAMKMISCELIENEKPKCFASAAIYADDDISDLGSYVELYDKMNKRLDELILIRFRDTLAKGLPSFKNKSLEDIRNIMNAMIALGWCELKQERKGWPKIEDLWGNNAN